MNNVIAACRINEVKRLVYTSSVHAFVELPHGQLIDETTPVDPERVVGHYAKTKAKAAPSEEFILSGYPISLKQMFYILQNVTGRKISRVYFPNWLLKWFIPFV
ncbi:MAG TPA: hypothetical protein VK029_03140 [Pseudogracilibacillus sp.]|nr:hypothetical protein [Pseudogracilibacillus sp.]